MRRRPDPPPQVWFGSWGSDRRLAAMASVSDVWLASAYNRAVVTGDQPARQTHIDSDQRDHGHHEASGQHSAHIRPSMTRSRMERGGRLITSSVSGSTPIARAGAVSVSRLIHRICVASSGRPVGPRRATDRSPRRERHRGTRHAPRPCSRTGGALRRSPGMRQPRSGGTRLRVSWSRPTPSTSSPAGDSPARRGRLIAHDPDDASIFERSVGIGAEHTVLLPTARTS